MLHEDARVAETFAEIQSSVWRNELKCFNAVLKTGVDVFCVGETSRLLIHNFPENNHDR